METANESAAGHQVPAQEPPRRTAPTSVADLLQPASSPLSLTSGLPPTQTPLESSPISTTLPPILVTAGADVGMNSDQRLQDLVLSGHQSELAPNVLPNTTMTDERVLALLQHWRYDITPWLDIFDLSQGFGIYVSLLASHSQSVLEAISTLATVSQCKQYGSPITPSMDELMLSAPGSPLKVGAQFGCEMSSEVKLLCVVLRSTRAVYSRQHAADSALSTILESYRLERPMTMVGTLGFYLLLRLELAAALIEERPLPISVDDLQSMPTPWHRSPLARHVFDFSMQALIYCMKALSFAYGEMPDSTPGGMVGWWLSLIEDLNTWYLGRSQEFQAVIETSDSEDGLPMVLFTNGAGVFGNQLYHTAMLLLLRHKPRTAQLPNQMRSSATSFLWHARRICGIVLHNELRSSWDPCLLSSLVMAAKRMSHEDQHRPILATLQRVEALTKWDIAHCEAILRAEWGI